MSLYLLYTFQPHSVVYKLNKLWKPPLIGVMEITQVKLKINTGEIEDFVRKKTTVESCT